MICAWDDSGDASGILNRRNHFLRWTAPPFFCPFWAALSWAFCWTFLSLLTTFLSTFFLAARALLRSLISRTASSARAFLSSGRAVLIFLISSRVTPSMALSFLKTFFFLFLPASVCFSFLWSLRQAVVHLRRWALSFLHSHSGTSSWSPEFACWGRGRGDRP